MYWECGNILENFIILLWDNKFANYIIELDFFDG